MNAVSPGATLTESVLQAGFLSTDTDWTQMIPLGRPNEPDDVARAVLFPISDATRNITGTNRTVAGGLQVFA